MRGRSLRRIQSMTRYRAMFDAEGVRAIVPRQPFDAMTYEVIRVRPP